MKIGDAFNVLKSAITHNLPVMLTSSPGEGKTSIVEQACKELGADIIISHPVVSDPTDAKGLPWVSADKESATFLPFGELYRAMKATKKTVWFLDDLGQASPAVQASFMQLLLARRVNGHELPDCVTFVAATNRRTDKAGVTGILEPVKSRFASILDIETNLDEWCDWAVKNDIKPEIVSFIRFRPDLLSDFKPTADMAQSPSPRTWHHASQLLGSIPQSLEFDVMKGAVGEGPATEFISYLGVYRTIPDIDAILKDPKKATISKKAEINFAVCTGLAYRANKDNFGAVITYAQRLNDAQKGEFGVLLLRDSIRRVPELIKTKEFKSLEGTELSKLILEN